jgi:hypothetical protein
MPAAGVDVVIELCLRICRATPVAVLPAASTRVERRGGRRQQEAGVPLNHISKINLEIMTMNPKRAKKTESRKDGIMRSVLVCLLLLVMAAMNVPAYAIDATWDLTDTQGTSWRLDNSGNAPVFQTDILANVGRDATGGTGEQNAGSDAYSYWGLGQVFPIASDATIKCISIDISGIAAGDYGLAVYELGPTVDIATNMPDPMDLSASSVDYSPLWTGSVTTSGSASGGLALFNLGAGETFDVNADTKYAFVITETTSTGLTWFRGGQLTLNGMMITTNNGGAGEGIFKNIRDYGGSPNTAVRQASLALYADNVPNASKATDPDPADEATDIIVTPILNWTSDSNTTSHDVYFGTASPGTFQGNQTGTTFDPGTLANSTTYYWRIDEKNANGTTTGDVWSFTTALPDQASDPSPSDEAADTSLTPTLSWTPGRFVADTDGHNVYLGTDFNDVNDANTSTAVIYLGATTDPNYQIATELDYDTVYYWRVDEVNGVDTWKGDVWSFTTKSPYTLTIAKCKVKAGKTQYAEQGPDANDVSKMKDSFNISGTADFPLDSNSITQIDISIVSVTDDEIIYSETITDFNSYLNSNGTKFSYSHKIPRGQAGAITSLKMDLTKQTFSIKAKNVDLTGLTCPVQLDLIMGDNTVSGTADETIVNGSRGRIPTRLMRLYDDTLIVTKAKARASTRPSSDSLSVKGEIAVADMVLDDNEPNLVIEDVNITWGDIDDTNVQTFTIPVNNFKASRRGHTYKCSKVDVNPSDDPNLNDGLVTAKIDLDKCTFAVSIKGANDLYVGPGSGYAKFGISFDTPSGTFDETDDVNLILGH